MPVNGISAEELMDCWEAAGCGYDAAVLGCLWASVPPEMRLPRLSADTVPDRYRGGFAEGGRSREVVDVSALPGPMRQEMTWCMFRIIELGGRVQMPGTVMLVRRLTEITAAGGAGAPRSLMDLPARTWLQQIPLAVHRRRGKLPAPSSVTQMRQVLLRFVWLLDLAYDTRPWWQRESWHPVEDPRVPVRQHEPLGRQAIHFHRIAAPWLHRAAQWHGKVALETGLLRWSTLNQRVFALTVLDAFLAGRGISEPRLAADPAGVRQLMLDFLGHVRASRASRGPTAGQPVSAAHAKTVLVHVEQFYLFMHDHKDAAAAATGEPGWRELGAGHAGFYRNRELPRPARRDPTLDIIDDTAMAKIMAGIGQLGEPAGDGGLGDPQAMRIMMLQARLGRRINEILMLDADPLLPLATSPQAAPEPGAMTARLRYQQTKIDGAPDTILVDAEIVAIIRAQQAMGRHLAGRTCRAGRASPLPVPGPAVQPQRRPALRGGDPAQGAHRAGPAAGYPRQRRTAGRFPADPPVPAHQGHQPAECRRPDPRRAALPGASLARDDHALRPDPGRNPRSRVPALPQADRRRARPPDRRPRPLRHAATGPADRPDLAQRLVPAAAPPVLRPGKRLPDLRQVRHRRDLPARDCAPRKTAPSPSSKPARPPSPPGPAPR